ncbi:hypothetical protein CRM22_009753 [Opisthorchis felineus]|uniref:Uncharacterized protein n=1 Tax=Opisthorchis felineus TaxID=147828 RepID=A0A4S2LC94_OPIFE|nr:hypothetical protein CRM22_009753 [Opisthorchis felineus]
MPERLGIKIAYIFTVLAATALGIVYLGLDPSLRGTTQTATQKCASAFSIQAVILLIPTAVLFIIRVFKDEDELDVFLIISYSFVGVAHEARCSNDTPRTSICTSDYVKFRQFSAV